MSLLRRRMMMAKEPDVPDTPTEEWDYFTIVMEEDGVLYINNSVYSTLEGDFYGSFLYSKNGGDWVEFSNRFKLELKVNVGDNIRVKSYDINSAIKQEGDVIEAIYACIYSESAYRVKGSVMSLLYGDDFKNKYSMIGFTLRDLFCSFYFSINNNLTRIETPNTFLPATTISEDCYSSMFAGCTNLTNAPTLLANTLTDNCYYLMFYGCKKINYIKMLATDISATNCLADWVSGVASTGTFVKNKDATWDTTPGALGDSGVPTGWTVITEEEEGESPYAFSFNIEAEKGKAWTANAEQLVQINKMFAIVTKYLGMEGGEFHQENAPQEFDLRINGVRNFNFYYGGVDKESDMVDIFISFSDGDGQWFGQISLPWNNLVVEAFAISGI